LYESKETDGHRPLPSDGRQEKEVDMQANFRTGLIAAGTLAIMVITWL